MFELLWTVAFALFVFGAMLATVAWDDKNIVAAVVGAVAFVLGIALAIYGGNLGRQFNDSMKQDGERARAERCAAMKEATVRTTDDVLWFKHNCN